MNPDAERTRGEVELRKLLPNLLTAGALCAGVASMHYALRLGTDPQALAKAIACIGVSFVLDGLDGRLARLLRATSRFGERFDSIADFVAFGAAPAFLLYQWQLKGLAVGGADTIGLFVAATYALCAAIRLARFAAQARKKKLGAPVARFFQGMPAPGASGAVLVPPMLELSSLQVTAPPWATAVYTLVIACLMVSKVPMISVKHIRISRRLIVPLMLFVGVLVIAGSRDTWLTLAVLSSAYLLSMPVAVAQRRAAAAKEASEAAALSGGAPPGVGRQSVRR
ncbi:MAG: phosphatidylcholine/phosphatidylserine synthase [Phycisphaeraceae bacterium]|nr:phosphatidylcholine/phosphatidylserine synthase [Phycisphaeraceae bacterium]